MATTGTASSGTVVQAWFPHPLDQELRKHAEPERRSRSSALRLAIEDRLQADEERQAGALPTDVDATGGEGDGRRLNSVDLETAAWLGVRKTVFFDDP